MNELEKIFYNNKDGTIHKWKHYFEIYDRHFQSHRNKEVIVLEIGVFQGGSLKMWKEYFGKNAKIYGLDINPKCKTLEVDGIKILIGSQEDRQFLKKLKTLIPKVDILIDDGGHTMQQQIITFEELYNHVKEDGIYLSEDLHTSYWEFFGGAYKGRGTFIEYSKNFIDYINAWHSKQKGLRVNNFTRSTFALHYYDSIIVIEKKPMQTPQDLSTGHDILPFYDPNATQGLFITIWKWLRNRVRTITRF